MTKRLITTMITIFCLALVACTGRPAVVRGSENPDLDNFAMSTGLDKKDLEGLFDQNAKSLQESGAMRKWKALSLNDKEASVAIFPVKNQTTEHRRPVEHAPVEI